MVRDEPIVGAELVPLEDALDVEVIPLGLIQRRKSSLSTGGGCARPGFQFREGIFNVEQQKVDLLDLLLARVNGLLKK